MQPNRVETPSRARFRHGGANTLSPPPHFEVSSIVVNGRKRFSWQRAT